MITKMIKYAIFCSCIILAVSISYANTTTDPSLTAISARSIGMGGVSLMIDDSTAVFSNPAGIANIRDWQVSGTSMTLLTEIKQNIASGAIKTQYGTFGFGYVNASLGGSFGTMRDNSNLGRIVQNPSVPAMGFDDSTTILTYARKIDYKGDLSLGLNLKFVSQSISGSSDVSSRGTSTNIDLGMLYTPEFIPWLKTGVSLQNALLQDLRWSGASNAQDSTGGFLKAGASAKIFGDTNLVGAFEFDIPRQAASSSSLIKSGLEWKYSKELSLRMGLEQRNSATGLNFGIGLEKNGFRFDYAFRGGAVGEDTSHIFSLSFAPEPEAPKPAKNTYFLHLTSPSNMSAVTGETVMFNGKVSGADVIKSIKINGKYVMPFVSKDLFSVYYSPISEGINVLTFEAFVGSPEAVSVSAECRVLRTPGIKDVPNNYFAKSDVELLNALSFMKGYEGGVFKPENPISRAELVTLLVKAKGVSVESLPETVSFKDMKGHWAAKFAAIAAKEDLAKGYPDNTFKPAKKVSRAEASVIISRFSGFAAEKPAYLQYIDVPIDNWASGNIAAVKKAGLVNYISGEYFVPKKEITRGEVAHMLVRTPIVSSQIKKLFSESMVKTEPASVEILQMIPPPATHETTFNSIIVEGKLLSAEADSVLLNSQKLTIISPDRSFIKALTLASGENTVEIQALDKKKNVIKDLTFRIKKP